MAVLRLYALIVYENNSQIPIGLIAMSVDNISDSAAVDVYHISAFKPGNGQGSEIMKFLCNSADEFKVRLCIQAEAQFNGRQTLAGADLISWYRKFGFNGSGIMYREPTYCSTPLTAIITSCAQRKTWPYHYYMA